MATFLYLISILLSVTLNLGIVTFTSFASTLFIIKNISTKVKIIYFSSFVPPLLLYNILINMCLYKTKNPNLRVPDFGVHHLLKTLVNCLIGIVIVIGEHII